MKIVGHIEIHNRSLSSLNIPGKGRSQWSSLAIGKQPGTEAELFIVHQSAQNKLGTKYKVKKNIEQIFTRFVNEGKATIRFKYPPHDICIKCDSLQLKPFLQTLKLGLEETVPTKTLKLSNITCTSKVPPIPKTKLVVLSKAAYPALEGFPRTLQILKINYAEQKRFDTKILRLQKLKVLDLSHNDLTSLPEELGTLSLDCLCLSHNKFGETPAQDPRWNWISGFRLAKSLEVLDLSHNELKLLPKQISKLKKLVILKIERNQLSQLPPGLGNLSNLRSLVCGHNRLCYLPGSIKRLHLDSIDLASNSFESVINMRNANNLGVPSLVECAARKVINCRIFYSPEIIPRTLVFYLDNAHYCVCGSACFEMFMRKYVQLQLNHIANTVTLSQDVDTVVPTDAFYCSHKCVNM
ncbi:Leucine-rich repeat protein 1 [Cryptotermes secundus]|uniref:Leucine-rich repeat protein 1 n=2 Tax=Cryptotermes secundus TaxID=105785 RepID=A0A2J7RIX6_9NEOP|nr:leucine-rich repeat protein 1 isoform X1 [Cryptotermes secundus]PNF40776.1 Leucine-rich repeat protein 1 [Cryptotermes secundus]